MSTGNVTNLAHGSVSNTESKDEGLRQKIKSRRTNEIVIGICGAVGCNLQDVISELKDQFGSFAYDIHIIKISSIIKDHFRKSAPPAKYLGKIDILDSLPLSDRYEALQDLGNYIRGIFDDDALAAQAVKHISAEREIKMTANGEKTPPRALYIIDQLKHPAEIELLRLVYRNAFYLVGVMSPQEARREHLIQNYSLTSVEAQRLIERDRRDNVSHGQQLEKTVHKADFFVKHSLKSSSSISKPCKRFVGLVHGENGITPTKDEAGMYAAYSASLKSACLSRQVGASISDSFGNILSVGWNDVPAAGGGLYNAESEHDQRCINHGKKCHNDDTKHQLAKQIIGFLSSAPQLVNTQNITKNPGIFTPTQATELARKILEQTSLGSIIEYSRAIHAEMEAILNIARGSGRSTKDSIMYTTTYPCHNCARHIIAAGISRVVYIEPYEKSLAMKLHSDAISITEDSKNKVVFENFEGVSPTRYNTLFSFNQKRKNESGEAIKFLTKKNAPLIDNEFLDSYLSVELKVLQRAARDSGEIEES